MGSVAQMNASDGKMTVLLVDDDAPFRFAMRKALGRLGHQVLEAAEGAQALRILRGPQPPDAALLDLQMPGMHGLDVLRRRGGAPTRIIVLTGHGSVQAAVEAMQLGAFSFLEKPVDAEELTPLLAQIHADKDAAVDPRGGPPLIGDSPPMRKIQEFVARVAPTDETVAIFGETGTGKEVVARQIHHESRRRSQVFVALNLGCVPDNLFESELFGHKKGSFTGATSDQPGMFRQADKGTLFLDEVAELPIDLQVKLLRTLEDRKVRPVGDTKEYPVDVRIVTATNQDLWAKVEAGAFREDLYFRLNVFPVLLPPLRDRLVDLVPLAQHLLTRIGKSLELGEGALDALEAHRWPGNVRELLNVLRRAALFVDGDTIDGDLLERMIAASIFARSPGLGEPRPKASPSHEDSDASQRLADVERAHIERVLTESDGNITRAAEVLGIDRRTLQRKLRAYDE